jgi:hypothetical protein
MRKLSETHTELGIDFTFPIEIINADKPEYYVSRCPDTGKQFLCKVGQDNGVELSDELFDLLMKDFS